MILSGLMRRRRLEPVRAATTAIPMHANIPYFGIGSSDPPQEVLLREVYGVNATATRAIANRIAQLTLEAQVDRSVADGTIETETLDDHPLAALLARPHPDFSRGQMLRLLAQWLVTCGEAYLLKVGTRLRTPVQLHMIPPTRVSIRVAANRIAGYSMMDGNGRVHELAPDVMVRICIPDPEDPWRAQGYLEQAGTLADAFRFGSEHIRRHFQSDATPKTVLEPQENAAPFSEAALHALSAHWSDSFGSRRGARTGTPAVAPPGYRLVQLAMDGGQSLVPILEFLRDEQLMAYGVPRSVLGQVVSGDRSSAETNQWVFDRYTIMPLTTLIEEALTTQLAVDFDPALRVRFAPFVSEDKAFQLKQEIADLEHAVRTPNQVRVDRGLDPVAWGETPTISTKVKAYDPEADDESAAAPADADNEDADSEQDERAAHAAVRRLARRRRAFGFSCT